MTIIEADSKLREAFPSEDIQIVCDFCSYPNGKKTSELVVFIGLDMYEGATLEQCVNKALATLPCKPASVETVQQLVSEMEK
jgi:hypothetical protein